MSGWFVVLVTLVLLGANAFFVGAEFAAMSARRSQLEPLADAGSKRAAVALDAMQRTGLLLATAQLGITVCSVLLGAVSEAALHHALVPVAERLGVSAGVGDAAALVTVTRPARGTPTSAASLSLNSSAAPSRS